MIAVADRHAHLSDPDLYRRFYEAHGKAAPFRLMPVGEPRLKFVLDWIGPSDDVIDIGCHKGEMTAHIWGKTIGHVVGLDISEKAIAGALGSWRQRRAMPDIDFRVGDAAAIPFPENSFEVAVLSEILEHVPDPAVCIAEAERVVRPHGCVVLTVPVNAVEMDQNGPDPEKSRRLGFELDLHVREYHPETTLADKPNLKLGMGHSLTEDEFGKRTDWYWRFAAFEVVK